MMIMIMLMMIMMLRHLHKWHHGDKSTQILAMKNKKKEL